jgi:hypothetical protein
MRRAVFLTLGAGTVLLAIACGGGATATLAPGTTPPPVTVPTIAPPPVGVGTGTECAGIPTIAQTPQPSFVPTRDLDLEARIPHEVDGEPVTDVKSFRFIEFICVIFGQEGASRVATALPPGVPITSLSLAQAKASVDGNDVEIDALRAPGTDANILATALVRINAVLNDETAGTLSQKTVGGKNVYVALDSDGNVDSYSYASGDVLFVLNSADESEAAAIFSAIP